MARLAAVRPWAVVAALIALLATGCEPRDRPGPAPDPGALPVSMAALGDSLSVGFGSCLALVECARNSWSTGDGFRVDSHYIRIRDGNPAIRGHGYNLAARGARARDLVRQAENAVDRAAAYVTVLVGANDICRGDADDMTSPAAFRDQVDRALATIKEGLPKTRVLVVSLPDLYRVWEVGHTNVHAVRAWNRGVCPALLADPTSTARADVERRALVRERVDAYNRALADACRAYGKRCRYDRGAAHGVRITLDMLTVLDYFHPDVDGLNALAEVTYPGTFTW